MVRMDPDEAAKQLAAAEALLASLQKLEASEDVVHLAKAQVKELRDRTETVSAHAVAAPSR